MIYSFQEVFASWMHGNVSQENVDDLWVITWIVCSFLFAIVIYKTTMLAIRKLKK